MELLLVPVLIRGGGRHLQGLRPPLPSSGPHSPVGEWGIELCLVALAVLAARGLYQAIRRRTPEEKAVAAEAVMIAFVLAPLLVGVGVPLAIPLLRGRSLGPLDAGAALLFTFGLYPLLFALATGERRRKRAPSPVERALERIARLPPARIAELTPPTEAVIAGRVSGAALRAPVSGRACVWFSVTAVDFEELRQVHEERSRHAILVDDGSPAQAELVLDGALVRGQSPRPRAEEVRAYCEAHALPSGVTVVEHTLSDGDRVLVAGFCRRGEPGERGPYGSAAVVFAAQPGDAQLLVTLQRREELVAELAEWRKHGRGGRVLLWAGVALTTAAAALVVAALFF